jgi:hypothetical protein
MAMRRMPGAAIVARTGTGLRDDGFEAGSHGDILVWRYGTRIGSTWERRALIA